MAERLGDRSSSLSAVDQWTYGRQYTDAARDAADIQQQFRRYERFYRALLLRPGRLPPQRDVPILDLPCGEGAMVYSLRQMGYTNVAGYDLDRGRLATGQKLGLPLHYDDVFAVLARQGDGTVGCVLAMDFLEHLEKSQVVDFLNQVHRVLSSGGRLLVRTPCADAPQGMMHVYNDFTHKWAATSGVLRQLLTGSGFARAEVFGEHPALAMSRGYLRVPLFKLITGAGNLLLRAAGLSPYRIWSPSMWALGIK